MVRRTKVSAPARKPRLALVEQVKPDPVAWKIALRIAEGNAARIEVVSRDELVVHNQPLR